MALSVNTNITSLGVQKNLNKASDALSQSMQRRSSVQASEPDAIVFTQAGLQGQSQILSVGRYDTSDLTVPNDSISSVAVRKGVRVTLYEHSGFTGNQAVITADTDALGGDIAGTTSSIVVENI